MTMKTPDYMKNTLLDELDLHTTRWLNRWFKGLKQHNQGRPWLRQRKSHITRHSQEHSKRPLLEQEEPGHVWEYTSSSHSCALQLIQQPIVTQRNMSYSTNRAFPQTQLHLLKWDRYVAQVKIHKVPYHK